MIKLHSVHHRLISFILMKNEKSTTTRNHQQKVRLLSKRNIYHKLIIFRKVIYRVVETHLLGANFRHVEAHLRQTTCTARGSETWINGGQCKQTTKTGQILITSQHQGENRSAANANRKFANFDY